MFRIWTISLLLCLVGFADACPNCVKGLAAKDRQRSTQAQIAYNTSIVFMAGMPFALTGLFGFTFWRLSKQARTGTDFDNREDLTPPCR
jgi:hypothetical protein